MKDLSEVMFMTRVEDDNSKFHPYNGVVDTHSVQNTQLSRMWGQASENYFASKYYEWADSEDLQLLIPTLDRGWDFMVERNGLKIQVKRFNPIGKNHNTNNVKLKRTRASKRRDTVCNNNYDFKSFDYLAVHDVRDNNIIIADKSTLFKPDGTCKTSASVYPTRKSKGLTHLGWEVFR
tara:strand:- start:46 stop:579 length:534 start_codon:yes stop_codon:yes gene_type:complete